MALLSLPCMIGSLSVVLVLLLISIHGTCSAVTSKSSCASSSSCGGISVNYPFSLYKPYTNTSSYCGYPGLRLYCDKYNGPLLFLGSYDYTITDISYKTKTISLVDTGIQLQSTFTPKIDHNVSLTPNVWLNYTDLVVDLFFFLNCSGVSNLNSSSGALINQPASSNYSSHILRAIEVQYNHNELTRKCEKVVIAPVLGTTVDSQQNLSSTYGLVLSEGFQLEWGDASGTEYCTGCENKGCRCGYNVASNSTYNMACYCLGKERVEHKGVIIGISLGASLSLFAIFTFFLLYQRKYKERKRAKTVEAALESFGSLAPKRYTFSKIRRITKSFNQKIGQGGYGSVFKGELMDKTPVAVKVFKDRESNGVEFTSEVVSIARTSHINVVRLLGFSIKGSKRALIYEFMPNGSLDKYLRENQNSTLSHMECTRLFEIAIGIARGLEYLHRGCNTRIIHFDIKPHNILLDQEYCPKISDFGLAKFCQPKESILSMSGLRGTIGYIAPEVFSRNFGAVSSKSDVYSYGMMVLEMFGGKQGKMELTDSSSDTYFPDYIYKCVELNNICSVFGVSDVCEEIVRKVTIVGLWCIQVMPHARPTMSSVLDMLDKSIEELALPPPSNVSLTPALVQEATDLKSSTLSIS